MKRKRFLEILRNFKNQRIGVVGDIIVDKYIVGNVERISPEAPVPVFEKKNEFFRPGGAANVALNIKKLEGRVELFGVIGDDEIGEIFKKIYDDTSGIVVEKGRKTTLKTRVLSGAQQILRIDWEDKKKIEEKTVKNLIKQIKNKEFSAIIVSDYAKGVITEKLMDFLKNFGVNVVVDPKPSNIELYKGVSGITPNLKEAIEIIGNKKFDLQKTVSKLIKKLSLSWAIITLGKKGVCGREKGKRYFHYSALKKEVFDVTGAGDTFVSTLAIALSSGASLREASFIANLSSAYSISHLGTIAPTVEDILEEYNEWKRKRNKL